MKNLLILIALLAAFAAVTVLLGSAGAFAALAVVVITGLMISDYRRTCRPLRAPARRTAAPQPLKLAA